MRTLIKRLEINGARVSPYAWNGKPKPEWLNCDDMDHHTVPKDFEQMREWAVGKFEGIPLSLRSDDWVVDHASIINGAKDAIDRLDFQKRMELESLDVDLLSEAFRGLPNLMSLVFENSKSTPGIMKLAQSGFVVHGTISWRSHVFQVILQALSKAKSQPRKIAWHDDGWHNDGSEGFSTWALNDITPLLIDPDQMVHLLSHLSVLHLEDIWVYRLKPMFRHFEYFDSSQALGHFIELCPQLERLFLKFSELYSGFTRETLMGKAPNGNLRSLTLRNIDIDASQLALCITTNKSLERLTFDQIDLTKGHWQSFFDHVKAECPPSLKAFQLTNLFTKRGLLNILAQDYFGFYGYYEEECALEYIHGRTDSYPPLCQSDFW